MLNKKYIYPNSREFEKTSYLLCSNQSFIHYISEKYNQSKFHELIEKNNLKIENFHSYQKNDIEWLLNHNYIFADADVVWIIDELYFNDVLSYHHLDKKKQQIVDNLIEKKILKYESTLFSKPEYDYFNYIFNKGEFSNVLDNKE